MKVEGLWLVKGYLGALPTPTGGRAPGEGAVRCQRRVPWPGRRPPLSSWEATYLNRHPRPSSQMESWARGSSNQDAVGEPVPRVVVQLRLDSKFWGFVFLKAKKGQDVSARQLRHLIDPAPELSCLSSEIREKSQVALTSGLPISPGRNVKVKLKERELKKLYFTLLPDSPRSLY